MFFDKKTKHERLDYQMIIEGTFDEYLNNKAKEGLIFHSIALEEVVFTVEEPCHKKYQIDYGAVDFEHHDHLEELGYKMAAMHKNIKVYVSDNIYAPDLHTDEIVRLKAAKHLVNKHPLIWFSILLILCLPLFLIWCGLLDSMRSLGSILKYAEFIVCTSFLIIPYIGAVFVTIQSLEIKRIVNRLMDDREVSYKRLNFISKFIRKLMKICMPVLLIAILCFIPFVLTDKYYFLYVIIRSGVILILAYLSFLVMRKYRIDLKVIMAVFVVIYAIGYGLVQTNFFPSEPQKETQIITVDPYMSEDAYYHEEKHLLYSYMSYSYNPEHLWNPIKYERFAVCAHEFLAKEIMKDDIVTYEKETRASNEYIEDILDKTGFYSSTDVKHKSYKEAFKTLKEYKHEFVDECYYNHHFLIARKDNKLLVSYMQEEDNYIDNVIEHYFK